MFHRLFETHPPQLIKELLQKNFNWDTVQIPINVLDYHYRSFTKKILPILKEKNRCCWNEKSNWGRHFKDKISKT
jgi:hypothetical protein